MLKIRLDKTKLSVSDNLVQIRTTYDTKDVPTECNIDPNDCKFGEIFLSLDGRIYYVCKFCEANFYCFKTFSSHFLEEHAIDWTGLIYPDGNFACCSKVEPDYSAYRENFEIIDDVIVEEKGEGTKDYIEQQEIVVEEEVGDDQHFQNQQVLGVKNVDSVDDSFYIVQQTYEPEDIYKNNFNDQPYVKVEKPSLEYKNEQELRQIEDCHPYVQMVVKDEGQVIEEEVYTQNESSIDSEQMFELDDSNNGDDYVIVLPKDVDLNCYQMPKYFFSTLRQIATNRCKFCNRKFNNLFAHYKQYLGKFFCEIFQCSEPFDSINELNEHNEEMHSDPDFIFKCFYCDFKDNEKQNLELHYRKIHLLERSFKCLKCDTEFFSQEELLAHDAAHIAFGEIQPEVKMDFNDSIDLPDNVEFDDENENDNQNIKNKTIDTESDTSSGVEDADTKRRNNHHIEVDDPMHPHFISLMKQFHTRRCKICKVKSSLLSTHYRKIHFEKFTCDINQCSEPFDTEEELAAHTAELHVDPDNPFKCAYCEYKTTEKRRLSYHYRRNHLVEKKYQCNYCPMKFFYEKERVQHHRVHTGEHPYSCDLCGQAFKTAVIMRMHKKRKHEPPSESCDVCGKMFSTKDGVRSHMNVHRTDKLFTCDLCGVSFLRKDSLTSHFNTHSVVKQFACNFCEKRFAHKGTLRDHFKTQHNPKYTALATKKLKRNPNYEYVDD